MREYWVKVIDDDVNLIKVNIKVIVKVFDDDVNMVKVFDDDAIILKGVSSRANRVAAGHQPSEEERRWLVHVSGEPGVKCQVSGEPNVRCQVSQVSGESSVRCQVLCEVEVDSISAHQEYSLTLHNDYVL